MPNQLNYNWIIVGTILVVLVASATALTWHGTIDGQAAIAFLGSIASGVIGVFAVGHGVTKGSDATEKGMRR